MKYILISQGHLQKIWTEQINVKNLDEAWAYIDNNYQDCTTLILTEEQYEILRGENNGL